LVSLTCVFLLSASKVVRLYLLGDYKLNRINPAYFDSVVGREKFLLFVSPEVESSTLAKGFPPLIRDLKNLASILGTRVEDSGEQRSHIWEVLRVAQLIERKLHV